MENYNDKLCALFIYMYMSVSVVDCVEESGTKHLGGGILIGIGEKEKFKSLGVISNYTPYLWCKAQLYLNYKKKIRKIFKN